MRHDPGDVIIENMFVSGGALRQELLRQIRIPTPDQTLPYAYDITTTFLSCKIHESIFTPGVTAEIMIFDVNDYVSTLRLSGGENVIIAFRAPGQDAIAYHFILNSIEKLDTVSMKGKHYKMLCVSKEPLSGQGVYVQDRMQTTIASAAQAIMQKYIGTRKAFNVEGTKGPQDLRFQNIRAYEAMEMLRKRAISATHQSSNFMFYENVTGFHFETLERMMEKGVIKTFKHSDAVGAAYIPSLGLDDANKQIQLTHDNILQYRIVQQMDVMHRIRAGATGTAVGTYNIYTNKYTPAVTEGNAGTLGGAGSVLSDLFKQTFNFTIPILTNVNPNLNIKIPKTNIPDAIPSKRLNLSAMMEQVLAMTVFGDNVLKAGHPIFCNIPRPVSTTGPRENDPLLSGKYIISKMTHHIADPDKNPRYTCIIEGLKGAYET